MPARNNNKNHQPLLHPTVAQLRDSFKSRVTDLEQIRALREAAAALIPKPLIIPNLVLPYTCPQCEHAVGARNELCCDCARWPGDCLASCWWCGGGRKKAAVRRKQGDIKRAHREAKKILI